MSDQSQPPAYFQYQPRSINDRAYWNAVAAGPRKRGLIERLNEVVGAIPDVPVQPRASEFLAARRSNDRAQTDRYWQSTRAVLSHRVLMRCLDGRTESGIDDSLLDWLWVFLTQPSWVVSAHLPKNDLPLTSAPQLDLAACEMAANLAETLETLKPWIDNQSGTLAQSIIHEIDRRVLSPFVATGSTWWYDTSAAHVNNWSGVCAGSILAACESLAALGQPRPEARAKALHILNFFLDRAFTPAGECDEGLGYWNYGVGFACLGWSRLTEQELHREVNMDRLKQVADYPRQVHLFDNWFYSGNDAALSAGAPLFATRWLAGATKQPWLAEWSLTAVPGPWDVRSPCVVGRAIEASAHLEDRPANMPIPPASRFVTDQQAAIFQAGPLVVAFAGGHNDECHNHNDVGHFCVWHNQKLIVPDLGAPFYSTDFFGPKRYTYLTASSRGHCCPVINGQEQLPGKDANGEILELDLDQQRLSIDFITAYPPAAHLARWTRSMARNGAGYDLVDEYTTTNAGVIEHVIWSTVEPKLGAGKVTLDTLKLTLTPGGDVTVEPVDPAIHKLRDFSQTLYRIAIRYRTTPNVALKVTTSLSD